MKPLSSIVVTVVLAWSMPIASNLAAQVAEKAPVNPAAQGLSDFNKRVDEYIALRNKADDTAPPQKTSADPEQIRTAQVTLASRLKAARASAKQGDIFTPALSAHLRQLLRPETADKGTKEAIREDNPGQIPFKVNEPYPDKEPLSSMPVNVLKALPKLPDNQDIDYRFIGRHLILLDSRANMVIDYIPNAIP